MTKTCSYYFKPEKVGYLPDICCSSCHEDADDFGYPLGCSLDDGDSAVCCEVSTALDRIKDGYPLAYYPTVNLESVGHLLASRKT